MRSTAILMSAEETKMLYKDKLREASRLTWAVKGHIPGWLFTATEEELENQINSYTKRLWNNNEAYLHFEGFEEAYDNVKHCARYSVSSNEEKTT